MEIGSFIELELRDTGEYHSGERNVLRLNTGRAGIYYSLKLMNKSSIYMPYYLCPTVEAFLNKKGIEIIPYFINEDFEPVIHNYDKTHAILLVNYFGISSCKRIKTISDDYTNVIIDNCPAFYNPPVHGCYNVYSARKFFGVPDGGYVVGETGSADLHYLGRDSSSETAAFLLKRIEKGSSAVYQERMANEKRLDDADVMLMSELTHRILKSIDYKYVKEKRRDNFYYAHSLLGKYNKIDPLRHFDDSCVPLVYPLVIEAPDLVDFLKARKVYSGRWWNSILRKVSPDSFEGYLSKAMVPLPIDQRYGKEEINFICQSVDSYFKDSAH